MMNEKQILDALRVIIDPDFQQDIVSLGFIKDLEIRGGDIAFKIELTTPACPIKDQFKEAAQEAVSALPGVDSVDITMTARQRTERKLTRGSGLAKTTNILAISSCKGGVGKSTVAAMLAWNLAERGLRVGFLDADIFGPSAPTLFNLHETGVQATEDQYIVPRKVGNLSVMSFGFMTGDRPSVMRGPMVSNFIQQLLHQVEWGELDTLIMDFPPGTGDIQLTISQSVELDGAVIVTTPHELSLTDVRKGIMMFDAVNVPVIGVVENMAYFECDHCQHRHAVFGEAGGRTLETRFGLETLATLPLTPVMSGTLDTLATSETATQATDAVVRALGRQQLAKPEKPEIEMTSEAILLRWPGQAPQRIANRDLRMACSCALCVDEMSHRPILDPASIPADIHAKEVRTIGNYALGITWSDGHSTGYFPYKRLREMAS